MNKALKITRYEWLNLKRNKTFYVMLIILMLGYILLFKELFFKNGEYAGGLISFAKSNWLPINFIMIPLLIIDMNIGKSSNEIFDAVNVSAWHKFLGKMFCVLFLLLIL